MPHWPFGETTLGLYCCDSWTSKSPSSCQIFEKLLELNGKSKLFRPWILLLVDSTFQNKHTNIWVHELTKSNWHRWYNAQVFLICDFECESFFGLQLCSIGCHLFVHFPTKYTIINSMLQQNFLGFGHLKKIHTLKISGN
jgi:hypothetical protein